MTGVAVAITASDAPGQAWLAAAGRGVMVAVPVAAGIYAWRSRPGERFGPLLLIVAFGAFLSTLAESQTSLVYSVGRVVGWATEPALLYLILSFPSGRLPEKRDRRLVTAAALLVAAVYLPAALLTESYPVPSQYTSCTAHCPHNAFFILGSEPGFVDSLLLPLRDVLSILLFLAVTFRLVQRVRQASLLMRRTLDPVLTVALLRCVSLAIGLTLRRVDPDSAALDGIVWIVAMALPLLALGFLWGLLSWRLYAGSALERLGGRVRAGLDPVRLERELAQALEDPGLRVVLWVEHPDPQWLDSRGRTVPAPGPGSAEMLTELHNGTRRYAAIVHDAALRDKPDFLAAVSSHAAIALENRRLAAEVRSALQEVEGSRARLVAGADAERRRIERDLHDGAQQRLVALRIQLELTEKLIEEDREQGMRKLHSLGDEVGATLEEIRTLARGVYPSLLADQGLAEALGAAAQRVPIRVRVEPDGIGRYPEVVESAVYFCCLEAMQNASKHAKHVREVTVSLKQDGALRFQVRDDGDGFDVDSGNGGLGLTNMRDRIVAVGGELAIRSSDSGTVVTGIVPVAPG
ncbi:MAG TPA: histidine kinase [Thermoleophilaceae bacterium]|jgi:signal transduction histidine kinase